MTAAALRRLLVGAGHGTTGSVFLRRLMRSAALMMFLVFGAALAFLIKGSMPAFRAFGLRFFTIPAWNPVAQRWARFALPKPVKGTIPDRKPSAIWRMPVWYRTGGSMRCVLAAEHDLGLASSRRKAS
jgi:ABC-type phosphate transport system permease subunit